MLPPRDFPDGWPHNVPLFVPRRQRLPADLDRYDEFFDRLSIRQEARADVYRDLQKWAKVPYHQQNLMRGTRPAWKVLTDILLNALHTGKTYFKRVDIFEDDTASGREQDFGSVKKSLTPVVEQLLAYMANLWYKPQILCDDGTVKPIDEECSDKKRKRTKNKAVGPRELNALNNTAPEECESELDDGLELQNSAKRHHPVSPARQQRNVRTRNTKNQAERGTEQDECIDNAPTVCQVDETAILRRLDILEHQVRDLIKLGIPTAVASQYQDNPPSTRLTSAHDNGTNSDASPEAARDVLNEVPCAIKSTEKNNGPVNTAEEVGSEEVTASANSSQAIERHDNELVNVAVTPNPGVSRMIPTGEALADRMMRYVHYSRKHDPEAYIMFRDQLLAHLNTTEARAYAERGANLADKSQ